VTTYDIILIIQSTASMLAGTGCTVMHHWPLSWRTSW